MEVVGSTIAHTYAKHYRGGYLQETGPGFHEKTLILQVTAIS